MTDVLRSDANVVGETFAVLALLGVWGLAVWGMARGYRRRRRHDEARFGALPVVDPPQRTPDGEAIYTGTTTPDGARVGAGGLFGRGPCRYWLEGERLVFARHRAPALAVAPLGVDLAGAHAGRVLAPGRIALVAWRLNDLDVETGFGFDDAADAATFADTVQPQERAMDAQPKERAMDARPKERAMDARPEQRAMDARPKDHA
jgi:hypothetical protein